MQQTTKQIIKTIETFDPEFLSVLFFSSLEDKRHECQAMGEDFGDLERDEVVFDLLDGLLEEKGLPSVVSLNDDDSHAVFEAWQDKINSLW